MTDIKNYWIPEIQEVDEFNAIAKTENPELDKAWQAVGDLLMDQFIETATERGIVKREKLLNIMSFSSDSIDTRKWRILARWNDQLPYTYRMLENRLIQLCGKGGFHLRLNANEYALRIEILLSKSEKFKEIQLLARNMLPANIVTDVILLQPVTANMYFAGIIHTGDYITIKQVM